MPCKSINVLVVEPNSITRQVLRFALEEAGYRVREAASAEASLALLNKETPDLVLQNLYLPDLTGTGLTRQIRSRPDGATLPILVFSNSLCLLEQARSHDLGPTAFLVRPFMPSHLLRTVCSLLRFDASAPPREYRPPADTLSVRRSAGSWRASAEHHLLVADDNPFEELHLAAWLEQAGFRVTVAKDGIQALELTQRFVFKAVVCDSLLSGMDGFELCLAIRRDPLLANLPVVLSPVGEAEPSDLNVARRVGARSLVVRRPESAGEWPESLCAILDRDAPATLDDHRHRQNLSGSSRN